MQADGGRAPGDLDRARGIRGDRPRALRRVATASRQEPGCLLYQPYRDPAEPRVFHIFEIYDDEAALEAHGASDHFRTYVLEQAVPLLEHRDRAIFETIDV